VGTPIVRDAACVNMCALRVHRTLAKIAIARTVAAVTAATAADATTPVAGSTVEIVAVSGWSAVATRD
jgi:hypothetical protein